MEETELFWGLVRNLIIVWSIITIIFITYGLVRKLKRFKEEYEYDSKDLVVVFLFYGLQITAFVVIIILTLILL